MKLKNYKEEVKNIREASGKARQRFDVLSPSLLEKQKEYGKEKSFRRNFKVAIQI